MRLFALLLVLSICGIFWKGLYQMAGWEGIFIFAILAVACWYGCTLEMKRIQERAEDERE